ncbi:sigma-70 family RNA polymerase sigma factor [Clostridium sediminicola]|uniref:sigma-70 family RNA polymerase sigma factor n=1 Tax=Clostridium sediminicola TaxID=3114879 RepID=UPI0031F1C87E
MKNLIRKAKEGDSKAVESIINKYMPLVLSEASKYHIPGYEYDDIVQHCFLSIIKAIKLYKIGQTSFSSFVSKVVKNNNVNLLLSKIKHNREIQNDELLDNGLKNYSFTIEDEVIAYEMVENLNKAIIDLEYEDRKVIIDFFINKKQLNTIALELEKTYRQVYYIKENAIKKVKRRL